MSDDRTVHARYRGMEIVRYDRSGKWYLEPTDPMLSRQRVSIGDAVRQAQYGVEFLAGVILPKQPGGQIFDALLVGRES